MKPENIQPRVNQEQSPVYFGGVEGHRPITNLPETIENNEQNSPESQPKSEVSIDFSSADITTSLPVPITDSGVKDVNDTTTSTSLLVANDKDVIENEWVRAAKKIVSETRDDPYKQEEEVGKLQVDYMIKRYGEEIKRS
ncbi:MAG: hypothetical protein WA087_02050 [Candidatus Saccharimonadales bacterium]